MKIKLLFIVLITSVPGFSQNGLESIYSQISVNPAALDFDSTIVNQTITLQTVVKNTGFGLLTVTDITSNKPVFDASPTTFTLIDNQEQIVEVTFTPDMASSFYATLSILNDSPTSLVEVICTGVGRWPLGVDLLKQEAKPFTIYPNPVSNRLLLTLNLSEEEYIAIDICSPDGKRKQLINTLYHIGSHKLDLSSGIQDLASGIYLLQIRIGQKSYSEKLIKF